MKKRTDRDGDDAEQTDVEDCAANKVQRDDHDWVATWRGNRMVDPDLFTAGLVPTPPGTSSVRKLPWPSGYDPYAYGLASSGYDDDLFTAYLGPAPQPTKHSPYQQKRTVTWQMPEAFVCELEKTSRYIDYTTYQKSDRTIAVYDCDTGDSSWASLKDIIDKCTLWDNDVAPPPPRVRCDVPMTAIPGKAVIEWDYWFVDDDDAKRVKRDRHDDDDHSEDDNATALKRHRLSLSPMDAIREFGGIIDDGRRVGFVT